MFDKLVTDVIAFAAKETGFSIDKLQRQTALNNDLGIAGDDGVELIAAFVQKYDVDMAGFPTEEYFGREGFHPLIILALPVYIFCKIIDILFRAEFGNKLFKETLPALTIDDLVQIAIHGSWMKAKRSLVKRVQDD